MINVKRINFTRINILSFFFCLIPFALITGPFFPDLIVTSISFIIVFSLIKDKEFKYFKNYFIYLLFFFILYIILNSLFSNYPIHSLKSSLPYVRFALFTIATFYLLKKNEYLLKYFCYALIFTYVISLTTGYLQYFYGSNIFGYVPQSPNRLTLLLNDDLILGGFLSRLFPLLIGLIIYTFKNNKFKYSLIFLLIIGTDTLIFLTGERTALALMLISVILFIIFIKELKILRIFTFVVSLVIIFIISSYNEEIKRRNIGYTLSQIGITAEDGKLNIFSRNHDILIRTSWDLFLDKPIIGIGPNNFRKFCNELKNDKKNIYCSTHTHNTYIQLISETGLIGIIIFLSFVVLIFKKFLLTYNKSINSSNSKIYNYQLCLLTCFILTTIPFLPSQNFFNNWVSIIYFLPVGFYFHSKTLDNV